MVLKKTLKNLIILSDKHSPRPLLYPFAMTKDEKGLLLENIKYANSYLEFGIGGSTLFALANSRANIYSVESDLQWIKTLKEYFVIRRNENKRLKIFHVDIGQIKEWGYPIDKRKIELFPGYSSKVFSIVDTDLLDVVLIDGRFRIACTLKTILECQGTKKLKILIHDFYDRENYHIVLKYLNELYKVNTLGVFEIKPIIDIKTLAEDYQKFKYDPA